MVKFLFLIFSQSLLCLFLIGCGFDLEKAFNLTEETAVDLTQTQIQTDNSINEGDNLTITLTLSQPITSGSVSYQIIENSATASDFEVNQLSLSQDFSGQEVVISIPIKDDSIVESSENANIEVALNVNEQSFEFTTSIDINDSENFGVCPDGYLLVNANPTLDVSNNFCVMKFEAKAKVDLDDSIEPIGCNAINCSAPLDESLHTPTSTADGRPWRWIDALTAKSECQSLGAGYDLISNAEWMAIAHEIEQEAANWSSETVGTGCIYTGNSNDSSCGYGSGTDVHFGVDRQYRSYLTLSSGKKIYDFSGNVHEFVDWTLGGAFDGLPHSGKAWASSAGAQILSYLNFQEFTDLDNLIGVSDTMAPKTWQPLNTSLNSSNGIGGFEAGMTDYGANGAQIRGGGLHSSTNQSGIYLLYTDVTTSFERTDVGFRCVYRP